MNRVVLKQKNVNPTPTEEVIAARKIVSVKVLGTILNVAISFVTGEQLVGL